MFAATLSKAARQRASAWTGYCVIEASSSQDKPRYGHLNMKQIFLLFLVDERFNLLTIFEQSFKENGFETDKIEIPYLWSFSSDYVNLLKRLFETMAKDKYLIFSPNSTELFLQKPNMTIAYSGYRSWFDPQRMRVIPHLWSPVKEPQSFDRLTWTSKPPLRIGFMGRSFADSRLANFGRRLPFQVRRSLVRGRYIKYGSAMALMNDFGISLKALCAFPRIETLNILKENADKYPGFELDIVEKESFSGSEDEVNDYVAHLERNTYIVCPRGTENYTYRIYETLCRGRIPVIIDTDVVLPKEIDWSDLSVVVPYGALETIYEIIRSDYESHSQSDFAARQQRAFSTMARLRTMRWVNDLAKEIEILTNSNVHRQPAS